MLPSPPPPVPMNAETVGLEPAEVLQQRLAHGPNVLTTAHQSRLAALVRGVVLEPMFLLLVVTAGVYLLIGSYHEATVLLLATGLVAGISLYPEARSDRALQALRKIYFAN